MNKRAQITLIIIFGIVLLVILTLFLGLKSNFLSLEKEKEYITSEQFQLVANDIEECLAITSSEGLYYIAHHGAQYPVLKDSALVFSTVFFLNDQIPYFYFNNETTVPTIKDVENALSTYIKEAAPNCLNIKRFEEQGFSIKYKDPIISTKIYDKSVKVKLRFPIWIEKEETTIKIDEFDTSIDSNIKKLLMVSKEIVEIYHKNKMICITCYDDIAQNNNIKLDILNYDDVIKYQDDAIWVLLTDKEYKINEKEFILSFMIER